MGERVLIDPTALAAEYNRATSHRFLATPESSILNRAVVTLMTGIRTARRISEIIRFQLLKSQSSAFLL